MFTCFSKSANVTKMVWQSFLWYKQCGSYESMVCAVNERALTTQQIDASLPKWRSGQVRAPVCHVTSNPGHMTELPSSCCRQFFFPAPPPSTSPNKLADMADYEGEALYGPTQAPRRADKPLLAICDPNHLLHRVVVLVFMCFLGFGELKLLHKLH